MDPISIVENMSSYNISNFSEMTGLPESMYWPVAGALILFAFVIGAI
ncbi:hypothetical protein ACTXJY_00420 [Corynebacterium casei]